MMHTSPTSCTCARGCSFDVEQTQACKRRCGPKFALGVLTSSLASCPSEFRAKAGDSGSSSGLYYECLDGGCLCFCC